MNNTRFIGGNVLRRRFAYLHKRDKSQFGLLKAVDYRDARSHLGSSFHIKQVWIEHDVEWEQAFDRGLRLTLVEAAFSDNAKVRS
jgi:hypothetical protein